jgi:hypothetical protein
MNEHLPWRIEYDVPPLLYSYLLIHAADDSNHIYHSFRVTRAQIRALKQYDDMLMDCNLYEILRFDFVLDDIAAFMGSLR